jgi:hypothetical protein
VHVWLTTERARVEPPGLPPFTRGAGWLPPLQDHGNRVANGAGGEPGRKERGRTNGRAHGAPLLMPPVTITATMVAVQFLPHVTRAVGATCIALGGCEGDGSSVPTQATGQVVNHAGGG